MGPGWTIGRRTCALVLTLALLFMDGCSARHDRVDSPSRVADQVSSGDLISARDRTRLETVVAARAARPANDGYRIGPDDLLDVRIPDLVEAQPSAARVAGAGGEMPVVSGAPAYQQGFRVTAAGEITVPMLGVVRAAGLTPNELEVDVAGRLVAAGILRAPQVTILVAEYRSGVVAVMGSVERPGLYPLTRPGATLADLVWAAGGPNREAGRVVEFVPAGAASGESSPIRLDLEALLNVRDGDRLRNPPAYPGDVVSIAPAGSVLVDGWVEKPGSYPISRGLTVRGALAAAGGHSFPADRRHVAVKRVLASGEDRSFLIDIEAVAEGLVPDVPVTDGDVIRLSASPGRLVPWGVWSAARELVHVGGSIPLF